MNTAHRQGKPRRKRARAIRRAHNMTRDQIKDALPVHTKPNTVDSPDFNAFQLAELPLLLGCSLRHCVFVHDFHGDCTVNKHRDR